MSVTDIILAGNISSTPAPTLGNWIATLDKPSGNDIAYGIAVDTFENSYVCGTVSAGTTGSAFIAKYNSSGVLQWQRTLDYAATSDIGYSISVNNNGDVYITGAYNIVSATSQTAFVAKYNTNGVIQWQKSILSLNTDIIAETGYGITVSNTGNVYIVGYGHGGTVANRVSYIAKIDSNGGRKWVVQIASLQPGQAVCLDSFENVYITTARAYVFKFNSNGVFQWQRQLNDATSILIDTGLSVATDSYDNVYVVGQSGGQSDTSSSIFIAKYSSSGDIIWQRNLNSPNIVDTGRGVTVDYLNNVYIVGQINVDISASILIVKYDSSGVLLWKNSIDTNLRLDSGYGIATFEDNIYISGSINGTAQALVAKLPSDGTELGTYVINGVSLTYSPSNIADSIGTLVSNTTSIASYFADGACWNILMYLSSGGRFTSVAVADSGNVYSGGDFYTSTTIIDAYSYLVKFNYLGVIQWQRSLQTAADGFNDTILDISVDSSENIYVTGYSILSGDRHILVAKYATTGTLLWIRTLDTVGATGDTGNSIVVSSAGDVFIAGQSNTSNSAKAIIIKYDSTGNLQFQKTLSPSTVSGNSWSSIALDSFSNIYVAGNALNSCYIAKYNSSGVLIWQKYTSVNITRINITVTASGNVYILGRTGSGSSSSPVIFKLDTNGAIQWQRSFDKPTSNDVPYSICTDTYENIYITIEDTSIPAKVFAKYDSNGVLQWQLQAAYSAPTGQSPLGIAVDASGNYLYICGALSGSISRGYVAKYPANGIIYGGSAASSSSFGVITVSTFVDTATSFTVSDGILVAADSALVAATTPTDATGTLTTDALTYFGSLYVDANNLTDAAGSMTSTTLTI
jgi:hypothetical protein